MDIRGCELQKSSTFCFKVKIEMEHDTKARPARVLGSWFHLYLGAIGRIPAQENQGQKYREIISDFDSQEEKLYHSQII